jgi:hypothetical protein
MRETAVTDLLNRCWNANGFKRETIGKSTGRNNSQLKTRVEDHHLKIPMTKEALLQKTKAGRDGNGSSGYVAR